MTDINLAKTFKIAAAGIVGTALAFSSFTTLKETERGIDYQFGKMKTGTVENLRGSGFSFKAPWTSVTKVAIDLQSENYDDVHTYTKDNQVITATLSVMYKIPQTQIVNIYKNNPDWKTKLETTVFDAAKSALGHQEAQNVAQNRDAIMKAVTLETQTKVRQLLNIEVIDVKMPNFEFTKDFENSVADAAKSKAELNRKITEKEQASVDSAKTVINAQAAKSKAQLEADAAAYTTIKTKEAEAQAFERIQSAVGRENMGTYLTTTKWNGQYPSVVAGNGGSILNIPAPK